MCKSQNTRCTNNQDYLHGGDCRLTEMLCQLNRYVDNPLDVAAWRLLTDIRTFFTQRFEYEDQLMDCIQKEASLMHRQQHKMMLEKLFWSFGTVLRDNRIDRDLCDFIRDWFAFHVENLDRPLYEHTE